MKKKQIPQRMCIGCRERMEKRNLIRVVRTPQEEVIVDPTGKKAGRGAYLCGKIECLEKAIKTKGLDRALNCSITPEITESLRKYGFDE
ncbi:MAG: nucleic acid-binding protein [Desulfitibacter sp. BRH_c19]|nr:MAG: nucleic acid-binding protein [Desulfitibacter sp. BRH_c19]